MAHAKKLAYIKHFDCKIKCFLKKINKIKTEKINNVAI